MHNGSNKCLNKANSWHFAILILVLDVNRTTYKFTNIICIKNYGYMHRQQPKHVKTMSSMRKKKKEAAMVQNGNEIITW